MAGSWWRTTASQGLLLRRPHPPLTWTGKEQVLGSQGNRSHWAPSPCSPVTVTELHKWLLVAHLGDWPAFVAPQEDPNFSCRFVLLVSGLGLGGGGGESLLGTQLLVDVVTGQLGDEGEQCGAAHVSRVVLAGNLLSHSTQSRDSINKVRRPQPAQPRLPHRVAPNGPLAGGLVCAQALLCPPARVASLRLAQGCPCELSHTWGLTASTPRPST